jgi:hypothetical protein
MLAVAAKPGLPSHSATGVYWKLVQNILSDGNFKLVLADAAPIKNVPGRKTDLSEWLFECDVSHTPSGRAMVMLVTKC